MEVNIKVELSWTEALALSCASDPEATAPNKEAIEELLCATALDKIQKTVAEHQGKSVVEVPLVMPVSLWARHVYARATKPEQYRDEPFAASVQVVARDLQDMLLNYLEDYDEILGVLDEPVNKQKQFVLAFLDSPKRGRRKS